MWQSLVDDYSELREPVDKTVYVLLTEKGACPPLTIPLPLSLSPSLPLSLSPSLPLSLSPSLPLSLSPSLPLSLSPSLPLSLSPSLPLSLSPSLPLSLSPSLPLSLSPSLPLRWLNAPTAVNAYYSPQFNQFGMSYCRRERERAVNI